MGELQNTPFEASTKLTPKGGDHFWRQHGWPKKIVFVTPHPPLAGNHEVVKRFRKRWCSFLFPRVIFDPRPSFSWCFWNAHPFRVHQTKLFCWVGKPTGFLGGFSTEKNPCPTHSPPTAASLVTFFSSSSLAWRTFQRCLWVVGPKRRCWFEEE